MCFVCRKWGFAPSLRAACLNECGNVQSYRHARMHVGNKLVANSVHLCISHLLSSPLPSCPLANAQSSKRASAAISDQDSGIPNIRHFPLFFLKLNLASGLAATARLAIKIQVSLISGTFFKSLTWLSEFFVTFLEKKKPNQSAISASP